jgi:hypothetical protein
MEMAATSTVFKKGEKKRGQGQRGPGRATVNAREAIARLVDGNAERMQQWLDDIAEQDGPLMAWRCMADVIEYHVPKLSRSDVNLKATGEFKLTLNSDDAAL